MWTGEDCASQVLIRSAVVGRVNGARTGIVPPSELAVALGAGPESPDLPEWVKAWIAADATRPWPPAR
jgi:hypothetical protein